MAVKHKACNGACEEAVRMQVDVQGWHLWALLEERTLSALRLVARKVLLPCIEHV
jgi:NADH:ubiquinone oxidoreductase subunit E